MSCGHCLNAVIRALSAVPGVQIEAIRIGRADVSYDESAIGPPQLEAAVIEAGYGAKMTVHEPTKSEGTA